jgi:hypothetical protein
MNAGKNQKTFQNNFNIRIVFLNNRRDFLRLNL